MKPGDTIETTVKILKVKKDVPTVLEVIGGRYILDHPDYFRSGAKGQGLTKDNLQQATQNLADLLGRDDPEKIKDLAEKIEKTPAFTTTHPQHYHHAGLDPITYAEKNFSAAELRGFYRINVIKYVSRYERKGGLDDLAKARDYLERLEKLERGAEQNGERGMDQN